MRTHRFFVSVLVAGALVAAGFMNPGLAAATTSAAQTGSGLSVSCDSPPDDPDATPANRDRFVELWSKRMADHDWLQSYANLKQTPQAILDEGFHAMSENVQVWLDACLLDSMVAKAGETLTPQQRQQDLLGTQMVIFGHDQLNQLRSGLADEGANAPAPPTSTPGSAQTQQDLADMSHDLVSKPSFTSADQPKVDAQAPTTTSTGVGGSVSSTLRSLINNGQGSTTTAKIKPAAAPTIVPAGLEPNPITKIPLVPLILQAVNSLLKLISQIQGVLFTLPVVNILASAFYKICAESATMPLSCSISLPIGVPIPADVTGDGVPDVLGALFPVTNLKDVGAKFQVTRLHSAPLPAHVFAVYDTPIVKKRIEVGFDGRASSLAYNQGATFTLKNIAAALTGDIQVGAVVTASQPGPVEALTFAVKDLVGGSAGVPASEENPMAGSVQMNPFPEKFTVDARLTHTNAQDEDTFNVTSTVPTTVTAQINQKTTTTAPKSDRTFTALIDQLPTSVTVDLVHQGEKQSIDYQANAGIGHVQATDTATPDVSHPGSYTQSQYDVFGVPTQVHVDLQGAQDIKYTANGNIPTASFNTKTLADNVLQQQIDAVVHQIPKSIHVTNVTTPDSQAITYDADSNLGDINLGMYDKSEAGDETNLIAKAVSIPTHLGFSMTKSTGVYDLSANHGIGLIQASLTRNGGAIIPHTGDHATVLKQGTKLGLDFQLTGFQSAHFDGHQKTDVSLGLDPGGQPFDAIADLDDPNVLATAHIAALPSSVHVVFDPDNGHATYTASSVIPEMDASFDDRAANMHGDATLTDLPKNIDLLFNTTGATPSATYSADSRLGSIVLNYLEKPGGLAIHGEIQDLPKYMKVGGLNPLVFDARTGPGDAPASSDIGRILFQFGTDGSFASPATTDDHAYLDTNLTDSTHAELLYHGLRFISVDTTAQALHVQLKNTAPRLFRAFLTTPTVSATGFIDKVPAEIDVLQQGNKITYSASSVIDEIGLDATDHDGDHVAVDITDVPATIAVTFDGANSQLDWAASSVAGGFSAQAHLVPATIGGTRAFDAGLTIADIPTAWHASWADGDVEFVTNGTGIGSIDAKVTNHTLVHSLGGDHLNAFFDEPNGDLDASLHISNLQTISYQKLTDSGPGGFEAKLNMGNHGQLNFGADVVLNTGDRASVSGSFTHLPSQIDLKSDGGRITYTGDDNPTLTLSVAAAQSLTALNNTPDPSFIHGVAVRDGADGSKRGVRAKLFITGLPDSLDLNSPAGTYEVNGFHPTNATLGVDAKLTTLADQPLTLELSQVVPTASPVNFKFGPFLSSTTGGTHNLSITYTSNQDLGALTAEATYGNTDDAKLEISEIPKSINVTASLGDTKDVGVTMNHGISDITASYKHVGDLDFAASVHLHDVPSAVNLHLGRETAPDGSVSTPDFTFTASQPGLDIDATATAAITSPADINAAADLAITNMGSTVTGQLDGTTLKINSNPKTDSFKLGASGAIHLDVDLGFSAGPMENTGNLGVNIDIHKLTLGFENASNLQLDLGITTGLKGDFTDFTFGIDSQTKIDLKDKVHVVFENFIQDIDIDIFDIDVHVNLGNVIDHFRVASNRKDVIFGLRLVDILVGYCDFEVSARPHAEFSTTGSELHLGTPLDDGTNPPAWLITPDPNFLGVSVPDFIVDIVMYFTSPYGNELGAGVGCHSRV
ncbi:hypothetical protein [Nocardioides marmorisolisilvae]|uniref:Choice-of-anchor G family protein n=1 Tax=Nocardioides marmorisolisilvae TaxID=1542737 RepID=A0A3N0DZ85_9ACTN|nr:hypothetical protein [Nocardioides marmorisolisilvae]RNL80871.1 hypothetical protein EFL95_00325 [Nocardioides marmorisolisilvae]